LGSLRCQPTRSSPWLIYSAGSDRSIHKLMLLLGFPALQYKYVGAEFVVK
jgi:hypothetical protein